MPTPKWDSHPHHFLGFMGFRKRPSCVLNPKGTIQGLSQTPSALVLFFGCFPKSTHKAKPFPNPRPGDEPPTRSRFSQVSRRKVADTRSRADSAGAKVEALKKGRGLNEVHRIPCSIPRHSLTFLLMLKRMWKHELCLKCLTIMAPAILAQALLLGSLNPTL